MHTYVYRHIHTYIYTCVHKHTHIRTQTHQLICSLGYKGWVSIRKEKTYHLSFGPKFSIISAFMNFFYIIYMFQFQGHWLEWEKGWKMCKTGCKEDCSLWLFQSHAFYLWEENYFYDHLIIGTTTEDKCNIFSYKDPDAWKS